MFVKSVITMMTYLFLKYQEFVFIFFLSVHLSIKLPYLRGKLAVCAACFALGICM